MKKTLEKAKNVGYEALWALFYLVCGIIGAIIAALYVLITLCFTAPIAALFKTLKVGESFSNAYYDAYTAMLSVLYDEKCCESKETES